MAQSSPSEHALDAARHTAAHLLAKAVLEQFPGTKLGIGPTIEHGFYYDFLLPEGQILSEHDLSALQKRVQSLMRKNLEMTGKVVSADEARQAMSGQPFKLELIDDLEAKNEEISLYTIDDFTDLCRGGHVDNTSEINPEGVKITSLAGAYWKGSEKNPMLTRVYGLLFESKQDLKDHLQMLEEAKKRDHRKLGQTLGLFFIDDTIGKGLPVWLPNGTMMKNAVEQLASEVENKYGYERVSTPAVAKQALFERSGHLPYYADSMYPGMEMDDGTYYLRPMNCPFHHTIYNHTPRSYRELPLRFAEYGNDYRNELSGALAGLLRVRSMQMNDAHIYCRKDQIQAEIASVITMTQQYFELFGLTDYWFRLSKWDSSRTDKYMDAPDQWEYSEGELRAALEQTGVEFHEVADEAAFYGPKIDVQFRSVIGREETMSTIQLDFAAKDRFNLSYTDSSGEQNTDVYVIHRAPLSTHERFMAFLIEHYAGLFPLWLSPVQVAILPVGEKHRTYSQELAIQLQDAGIRVKVNDADETVGKRIRATIGQKVPYMLVIGDKEAQSHALMVRKRGEQEAFAMPKEEFITHIQTLIRERSTDL